RLSPNRTPGAPNPDGAKIPAQFRQDAGGQIVKALGVAKELRDVDREKIFQILKGLVIPLNALREHKEIFCPDPVEVVLKPAKHLAFLIGGEINTRPFF